MRRISCCRCIAVAPAWRAYTLTRWRKRKWRRWSRWLGRRTSRSSARWSGSSRRTRSGGVRLPGFGYGVPVRRSTGDWKRQGIGRMALSITKELESTLGLAFAEAKARRHEHVTLEHLLYALLRDPVAARILRACGARLQELKRDLEQHLQESQPQLPDGFDRDPEQTRAFQRVLERAAMQGQSSGKETIDAGPG